MGGVMGLWLLGCLNYGDRIIQRDVPNEDPSPRRVVTPDGGLGPTRDGAAVAEDPHAVLGISPNHAPFSGGRTAELRGNGFASDLKVWFGEVPAAEVIPIDPNRAQVTVPPGVPGAVDVITQNGDDTSTRRALRDGFEYDPFYLEPDGGATVGGSVVTLVGSGVDWNQQTEVLIDLKPCEVIDVETRSDGTQVISCRIPEGTPGRKVVTVETGTERSSVADAFTYTDSAGALEGGLSGDALLDEFTIHVLDGLTGGKVVGAAVILNDAVDQTTTTDESGRARFEFEPEDEVRAVTVTVAAPCRQPITIVGVPVDTATLYLEPILSPACIPPDGEIPRIGGGGSLPRTTTLTGELLWGENLEFRPGVWTNVPPPANDDEVQTAYVFELSSRPSAFILPSRLDAVTTDDSGDRGYLFSFDTRNTNNLTLYALAGIEDRSVVPRRFTPYSLGVVQGVDPVNRPSNVFIRMQHTLDHQLLLDVEGPLPTPKGPDRVQIEMGLRLGRSGFLLLPSFQREALLPQGEPLRFVGLPALTGLLTSAEYTLAATATSGPEASFPTSYLELLSTRQTNAPVPVSDFVAVPQLRVPSAGGEWDGRSITLEFDIGGHFDLVRVRAARGLSLWTIIAPGDVRELRLPDLSEVELGLEPGLWTLQVSAARARDFSYATLKERHFFEDGWTAHATDEFSAIVR